MKTNAKKTPAKARRPLQRFKLWDPARPADDHSCRRPSEFEFVAVHEAAHAVLTRVIGRWPHYALVDPSGEFGRVEPSLGAATAQAIRLGMVMLGAGGAAERRLWQGREAGDGRDLELMQSDARRLHGTLGEWQDVDAEVRRALAIADRLVNERWAQILTVARGIIRMSRLVGAIAPLPAAEARQLCEECGAPGSQENL